MKKLYRVALYTAIDGNFRKQKKIWERNEKNHINLFLFLVFWEERRAKSFLNVIFWGVESRKLFFFG